MTLCEVNAPPDPALAKRLAEFERQFTYPLGDGRRFYISHGEDYTRFYRSMGESICWVAEDGDRVVGTLSAAMRWVMAPGQVERPVLYAGDLKIAPSHRGKGILHQLFAASAGWARSRTTAAFGIVMDGTARVPSEYTGLGDVPRFQKLGSTLVYRMATSDKPEWDEAVNPSKGMEIYRRLTPGLAAVRPDGAEERSEIAPLWLCCGSAACGRLEDTRRAKRLYAVDGEEIRSAHLSGFAFDSAEAAVNLLLSAASRAARAGAPALFFAVNPSAGSALERLLGTRIIDRAPASIYGVGLEPGAEWSIHSSEI